MWGVGGMENIMQSQSGERDSRKQSPKPSVDNEAKPSPSGEATPKSLPQEVVEAWNLRAGFRLGWLGEDQSLGNRDSVEKSGMCFGNRTQRTSNPPFSGEIQLSHSSARKP